jgi:O-antigen ligase
MSGYLPETAAAAAEQAAPTGTARLVGAAAAVGVAIAVVVLVADARIAIVAAALLVALVVGLRYPFAAVLMYMAAATIHPEELGVAPVFLHLQRIFAALSVVALVLPQIARRTWQPWHWERTDGWLLALGAAACAAVPLSVSRPWALNGCYELAKLAFLYATIRYTATSVPRLRSTVWVMLLVTAFAAVMAIRAEAMGHFYVGEHGVARAEGPTSTTGDPNAFAYAVVAALPFALLLVGAERRLLPRVMYLALVPLFLYAIALTGARGAVVMLLAVLVLIVLQSRRRALALTLAAASLAVAWSATPPDLKQRYLTLRTYQQEATYQGRVNNLKLGLRMLRDRPLTGYGVTCFRIARVEEYDGQWSDAHNLLAQVAGETGVLGLAAFTLFLATTFATAWRARRTLKDLGDAAGAQEQWLERLATAVLILLVGLLVQGLGSHNLLRWHFYYGAALAANCWALARAAQARAAEGIT